MRWAFGTHGDVLHASINLRKRMFGRNRDPMGASVVGEVPVRSCHAAMAYRSYVMPSSATTGSLKGSRVMGHSKSSVAATMRARFDDIQSLLSLTFSGGGEALREVATDVQGEAEEEEEGDAVAVGAGVAEPSLTGVTASLSQLGRW